MGSILRIITMNMGDKIIAAILIACLLLGIEFTGCLGLAGRKNDGAGEIKQWETPGGNSYFGHWTTDAFGLPAFNYTFPHDTDKMSQYGANRTDHWHQVGNDRMLALGFNEGYVQMYTYDNGARWLNLYNPSTMNFAGGFGYVKNGGATSVNLFSHRPEGCGFDRAFGMGYYSKKVSNGDLVWKQTVFAPFGNDSVLLSRIDFENNGGNPANLDYYEYWDMNMVDILYGGWQDNQVINAISHYLPSTEFNKNLNAIVAKPTLSSPIETGSILPFINDLTPPVMFLASLNSPVSSFDTNQDIFFGGSGVERPADVENDALSNSTLGIQDDGISSQLGMFCIQTEVALEPGESRSMYFLYGYGEESEYAGLIEKYRSECSQALEETAECWRNTMPEFHFPDDDGTVAREMAWDYYHLRSGANYDKFFGEHFISQGCEYQYVSGMNGATRDPLQHALPMVCCHPELAKETIKYTLKQQLPGGEILYSLIGSGIEFPFMWIPSDTDLWLLWLAAEYVLATRDFGFLDEMLPYYPLEGNVPVEDTVYNHLKMAYYHLIYVVGVGPNNLIKIRHSDWNDDVTSAYTLKLPLVATLGESTHNTAMATYILPYFAELAKNAEDDAFLEELNAQTEIFRTAVKAQWNGKWLTRGYLGDGTPYGYNELWLEPQPWAIISNCIDDEQTSALLDNIWNMLQKPSKIGALVIYPPIIPDSTTPLLQQPGFGENGGVWYAINGPLVWALSMENENLAWLELKKNTFANHADARPDLWYGVWSGPDTYVSVTAGETLEGSARGDQRWPVQNMHSHAWPLYSCYKMAGMSFDNDGLTIDPKYPFDEFSIDYGLIGLEYKTDSASGYYTPLGEGQIQMKVRLPSGLMNEDVSVNAGGSVVDWSLDGDFAIFNMPITKGVKTTWDISMLH